ncbi:cytochrome C oxidase subunit IV family protein [uncultured Lutibacter sp.]|uniref:cytochrome C oxidase subunit IV family protein n=1 Tax=uncultured Lutibacter sp. TaxID=437739 RepID=UPI00260C4558|nr:cytochrome C oxidase subunit IV family protein [uncultured Lutibacter sp.]
MNSRIIFVWILLVLLTVAVGVISSFPFNYTTVAILGLSAIKFIGVSFYFMELKKAHIFWKISVLMYVLLFSVIVFVYI